MTDADRERAREIIDRVRVQNWKNGGVLTMDDDEAEAIVAAEFAKVRAEERAKFIKTGEEAQDYLAEQLARSRSP